MKCPHCGKKISTSEVGRALWQRRKDFKNEKSIEAMRRANQKMTYEDVEQAIALRDGGWTVTEIADFYGVSRSTIHRILKDGPESRPRQKQTQEKIYGSVEKEKKTRE